MSKTVALGSPQTFLRGSDLSGVVPADVNSAVQLPSGSAVQDQPLSLQGLHRPTAVQIYIHDVTHWGKERQYRRCICMNQGAV